MRGDPRGTAWSESEPALVTVTCNTCGGSLRVTEETAGAQDEFHHDRCSEGPVPSPEELEDPTVDEIREDLSPSVAPDAEPGVTARLVDDLVFGSLAGKGPVVVELSRGTKYCGSVTIYPEDVSGTQLEVSACPSWEVLDDEAVTSIVSLLSKHTQLIIEPV